MDYSFIIRRAKKEDAQLIRNILQESFKKYVENIGKLSTIAALEESIEDIEKDIENKYVAIAMINNKPVGTIRFELTKDHTAQISRFGVCPNYHNIGIGKALMNLVDKLLVEKGVKKAYLYTASNYNNLVRFYYGRGFYVYSVSHDTGYPRAMMIKEY